MMIAPDKDYFLIVVQTRGEAPASINVGELNKWTEMKPFDNTHAAIVLDEAQLIY